MWRGLSRPRYSGNFSDSSPLVATSYVPSPWAVTVGVSTTYYSPALLLDSASLTISSLGSITLPSAVIARGVDIVVSGTLSGVQDLTLDTTTTMTFNTGGRSFGLSANSYSFSSLRLLLSSRLTAPSFSSISVTNLFQLADTAFATFSSVNGAVLSVGQFDMAAATYITFTGSLAIQASVSFVMRAGSYISGDGGGFGASLGCGVAGATGGSGGRLDGLVWLVFAALPLSVLQLDCAVLCPVVVCMSYLAVVCVVCVVCVVFWGFGVLV